MGRGVRTHKHGHTRVEAGPGALPCLFFIGVETLRGAGSLNGPACKHARKLTLRRHRLRGKKGRMRSRKGGQQSDQVDPNSAVSVSVQHDSVHAQKTVSLRAVCRLRPLPHLTSGLTLSQGACPFSPKRKEP